MIVVSTTAFCHDGYGNFVMLKRGEACRDENGNWDLVAGTLEDGLTAEDNMRKGIHEEIGCDADELEFLGYRDVIRKVHIVALDFSARIVRARAYNAEPHKHDEMRWVALGHEPYPRHSQLDYYLAWYAKELARIAHG